MLPLQDGEEVVLTASPSRAANFHKYLYTLGFYGIWRKRDTGGRHDPPAADLARGLPP